MYSAYRITWVWPLLVGLVTFWPVWIWYVRRLGDGGGEVWGLVSMMTALVILRLRQDRQVSGAGHLIVPLTLLLSYIGSYNRLPPILRAAIAFSVLATLSSSYLGGRRFDFGIWGLFMLALPVVSSFQFVFAYPLRLLVGWLATPLIQLSGFMVSQQGTLLVWGNR